MPTLTWAGKDEALNVAKSVSYRLLEQDSSLSYGDFNAGNMIIQGDNLAALKSLLPYYRGMVRCIYIDPPYNTGAAFKHYDDNVSHATWLSLMYPRLEILRELLADNGSIWISIDDTECHYLKVICDEIFGRENFVNMVSINMKNVAGASGGGEDKRIKKNCEYLLVYANNYEKLSIFNAPYSYTELYKVIQQYNLEEKNWHYTSVLKKGGEKIYIGSTLDGDGNEIQIFRRIGAETKSIKQIIEEENITEKEVYYRYINQIFEAKDAQSSIRTRVIEAKKAFNITDDIISIEYVPKTGKNRGKKYEQFYKGEKCRLFAWLKDITENVNGVIYRKTLQGTYWDYTSNINNLTKEGNVVFPNGKKPESLVERILFMSTTPSDIVLDSFLGSGTTAAVAQKMNRRYIGIEIGEHAVTHVVPRLKKVIDGEEGGISKAENWQGGGGFSFFRLGKEIFTADGRIQKGVDFKTLAAHIWMEATRTPYKSKDTANSPLLGVYKDTAYYLLYNGILGDKRPQGGNVLTKKIFSILPPYNGLRIIYGESSRIRPENLKAMNIIFRQTPKEIPAN